MESPATGQESPLDRHVSTDPLFVIQANNRGAVRRLRLVWIIVVITAAGPPSRLALDGVGWRGVTAGFVGMFAFVGLLLGLALWISSGVRFVARPYCLEVTSRRKVRTFWHDPSGRQPIRIASLMAMGANGEFPSTYIRQGPTKVALNTGHLAPKDIGRIVAHLQTLGASELDVRDLRLRDIPPEIAEALPWNIRHPGRQWLYSMIGSVVLIGVILIPGLFA